MSEPGGDTAKYCPNYLNGGMVGEEFENTYCECDMWRGRREVLGVGIRGVNANARLKQGGVKSFASK